MLFSGWAHVLHATYKPWGTASRTYYLQHLSLFTTTFVFVMGLLFKVSSVQQDSMGFRALSAIMLLLVVGFGVAWSAAMTVGVVRTCQRRHNLAAARKSASETEVAGDSAASRPSLLMSSMTGGSGVNGSSGGGGRGGNDDPQRRTPLRRATGDVEAKDGGVFSTANPLVVMPALDRGSGSGGRSGSVSRKPSATASASGTGGAIGNGSGSALHVPGVGDGGDRGRADGVTDSDNSRRRLVTRKLSMASTARVAGLSFFSAHSGGGAAASGLPPPPPIPPPPPPSAE